MLVVAAGIIQVRVAVFATVGCNMDSMAEYGAAGTKMDLLYRMTFLTVGFDTENIFVIMTAAAGSPLFHICHCRTLAAISGNKNFIVAVSTCKK